MNLADAAEMVLKEGGEALDSRQIAERAIARGLVSPKSETPWTYVAAAIRKDNRRRAERREPLRFEALGAGKFQIATPE